MNSIEPIPYDELVRDVYDNGGFTLDIRTGTSPIRGYAVGAVPYAERRTVIRSAKGAETAIYTYVIDYGRELRGEYKLGAWVDGHELVLDLVLIYQERASAMNAGRAMDQDAIYDLAARETIYL